MSSQDKICRCPDAYPDWDGQSIDLGGSCVHEMKIPSFFHMPVSYDLYVGKQAENIEILGLIEKWPGFVLTKTGMWGGKIIRLVEDNDSPSRLVHYIPGSFLIMAKMHHGGIGSIQKVLHQMQLDMIENACMPKEIYLAHLTCPICSERKGGDKILILRRYTTNKRIQERIEANAKKAQQKVQKKEKLKKEQVAS